MDQLARQIIADHLAIPLEEVTDRALFQNDLGADSLDLVQLTMIFEEKFDVEIGDEESAPCLTVGEALSLLRQKAEVPAR